MKSLTLLALTALATFASAAPGVQVAENIDMDAIAARQVPVPSPEGCAVCFHPDSPEGKRPCPAGLIRKVQGSCSACCK